MPNRQKLQQTNYLKQLANNFVVCLLIGLCFLSNPAKAINLKVDRITINTPLASAQWTQVNFTQPFSTIPVVVVLPRNNNPDPASIRIRNVTLLGFEAFLYEPDGEDGATVFTSFDYFAAEPGSYNISGRGRIIVGTLDTDSQFGRNIVGAVPQGDIVRFPNGAFSSTPAVIAQVQTVNSQATLMPGQIASPWLETAIDEVNSNFFQVALERAETSSGLVLPERIGYVAMPNGAQVDINGNTIEAIYSSDSVNGWSNGCSNINFNSLYLTQPLVIASQNTRDGSDGGWVRRCDISNNSVGVAIDEDRANDTDRSHTSERVGMLVISNAFNDRFRSGRMAAGSSTISSSNAAVQWTTVLFPNPFDITPMIFSTPTDDGDPPAALRIRNVSPTGFDIAAFQPAGSSGAHPSQTIDYIAIAPGVLNLDNDVIFEAGSIDTSQVQANLGALTGWDRLNFQTAFNSPPAVLFQIQTLNNELLLDPNLPSVPFLTVASDNVSATGVDIALERNEVGAGVITSDETIGYFAVNNLANSNIASNGGVAIDFEMFRTPNNIQGYDEGCFNNNFSELYNNPHAVATKNTRNGNNGGWLRRCGLQLGSIGLFVDEDIVLDGERSHTNETASVFVFDDAFEADISQTGGFVISHDGSGINCLREVVTISVLDNLGGLVTNFGEAINLSTTTNNGSWYLVDSNGVNASPPQGNLNDVTADDGAATYTFDPADGGQVVLYLQYTQDQATNINVSQGALVDDNSEGDIRFRPFGFTLNPSPIPTQIAGRPFNVTLTAAGQTPAQPQCGVIEEYTGVRGINFWSNYDLPNSGTRNLLVDGNAMATSSAASTAQAVTFINGIATIGLQYDDVGRIGFFARDDAGIGEPTPGGSDEIIGGAGSFVVRPFAWDIQADGDPDAQDASASVYRVAGDPFNSILRSILWQTADDLDNNGQADLTANLSDNGVTPNIANIGGTIGLSSQAQIVTNSNGALATTTSNFASFAAPGTASQGTQVLTQSWSEVGIVTLSANHLDFMGSGQSIAGRRTNIGRFIPADFLLTLSNDLEAQCGSFSYAGFNNGTNAGLNKNGQSDALQIDLVARNRGGNTTLNYQGVFARLNASGISAAAFDASSNSAASGSLSLTVGAPIFTNGQGTSILNGVFYQYDSLAAPFNLRADLTATDLDTVSGSQNSSQVPVRLGRLQLQDTYGSELASLEMPVQSEYFDGTRWLLNNLDNCTTYVSDNLNFIAGSYQDGLSAGETNVTQPTAPGSILSGGRSAPSDGFWFSAPGDGNAGSVLVEYTLSADHWLLFDWDNDAAIEGPNASVNFGLYRGSDRMIYWREL